MKRLIAPLLALILGLTLTATTAPANADTLPRCKYEDGSGQRVCVWDARHMGNGTGISLVIRNGDPNDGATQATRVTHRRAHHLAYANHPNPRPMARTAPLDGCKGQYILMADTMVYDHYENHLSKFPKLYQERLTATVAYYHCPNGRRADKVKPQYMSWCYSHLSGSWPLQFDGFKGNAFFADGGNSTDPPTVKVPNNRTVQNCVTQDLSPHVPRWLRLDWSAGWSATGYYVRHGLPDEDFQFKDEAGSEFHIFNPAADVALGDWTS